MSTVLATRRCPACLFNYRIARHRDTSCSHEVAVVELLSYSGNDVLHRQPFIIDEHLAEAILDWLTGQVSQHVVFPPYGCLEVIAQGIASSVGKVGFAPPEDLIEIEVPESIGSVSDWLMYFWDIDDRILANALMRSSYTVNQIADLGEQDVYNLRLVGSGRRGRKALEARMRHNRLPPEAHHLLYKITQGRDGRQPPM